MKNPSIAGDRLGARGRATRTALLDAGERLLDRTGFEALTSTAVAAEAGVSTGTFYRYFSDKHALLAELFAHRLDEVVNGVDAVLSTDSLLDRGLGEVLARAVDLVVDAYRRHSGVLRTALASVSIREELRGVYWQRHSHAVAVVERFLRRGQAARMVRDADARVLAHTVLVVTEGLNHPVVLTHGDDALVAGIRAQVATALAALLAAEG